MEWARANPAKQEEYRAAWRRDNPGYVYPGKKAADAAYYRDNAAAVKARVRAWAIAHPEATAAQCRRYQAKKRGALPAWADAGAMKAIYTEARRITEATGIPHHVDHIVPLTHDLVCGLHCEANLRVVTAAENIRKRNRFSPG